MAKKSKIPKELLRLLEQRKNAAEKAMCLDAEVEKILTDLNIVQLPEYVEFQTHYGCQLYTEPYVYYRDTIKILEKYLQQCT